MDLLLYFIAFGSVFALLLSIGAGALWLLIRFVRAWGRFFSALLNPAPQPRRTVVDANPHLLKRAGQ